MECSALVEALQQCEFLPRIVTMLAKSLHRVLQLAPEPTIKSLRTLDATSIITHVMEQQKKVHLLFKDIWSIIGIRDCSFYRSLRFPMLRYCRLCNEDHLERLHGMSAEELSFTF